MLWRKLPFVGAAEAGSLRSMGFAEENTTLQLKLADIGKFFDVDGIYFGLFPEIPEIICNFVLKKRNEHIPLHHEETITDTDGDSRPGSAMPADAGG